MALPLLDPARLDSSPIPDSTAASWPAELRLLLGAEAAEMLTEFFARLGGVVVACRATQVAHRPHRSTAATYRVEVEWTAGDRTSETVVAMIGMSIPIRVTELTDGTTSVAMWRWPDDPQLPGLSSALDRAAIEGLFDGLGIGGRVDDLRVRAYRPGRRAVVEVRGERGRIFLKIVRPDRVRHLHDLHRSLAEHLPVPNSAGWSADGIVVMPAVDGLTLRRVLQSRTGTLPAPVAISQLLDALPSDLAAGVPRRHWLENAKHHARVIRSTVPSAASDVDDLLARLIAHRAAHGEIDYDVVAIHGDLYEAQLIIDHDGAIAGLLDVDTAGAGHRIDDDANFIAHLSVLATVTPSARRIRQYGTELLAFAESRHPRHDLRARIAAATIGLATGPFRVLEPRWEANTARRLALADQWLTSSAR